MRLLVDMDGVLVDWTKQFEGDLDRLYPHLDFPLLREFSTPTHLPKEHQDAINHVKFRPGFYHEMEPIAGAIDAVNELSREHDMWICSTPEVLNPTCASDKYNWVGRYMGDYWRDRLILTRDKTLVDGDYLIDDRPDVQGVREPTWKQILFEQPYNDHVNTPLRLSSWYTRNIQLDRILV